MSSKENKSPNILVVDNEEKICNLIKVFLSKEKDIDMIITATDTRSALSKMQNQDFHILIIDQVMQGKTGTEFIQQIKKVPKYNKLKVLLISGCLTKENVHEAINMGIKNILVKPFTKVQLLEKIEEIRNS